MLEKIKSWPGVFITVALSAGATYTAHELWESLGWTTPEHHHEDFTNLQVQNAQTQRQIAELSVQEDDRFWAWKCDEWTEELDDMLKWESPSPLDRELISRQRKKMEEHDCARFDD